ncbi:hypothetical protein ACF09C_04415 [Streptomyces sp. NPDC014870]
MPTVLRELEDDHLRDGASGVSFPGMSFPGMSERIASAFPQPGRERL